MCLCFGCETKAQNLLPVIYVRREAEQVAFPLADAVLALAGSLLCEQRHGDEVACSPHHLPVRSPLSKRKSQYL